MSSRKRYIVSIQTISPEEYQAKMNRIVAKGMSVHETLIAMIEEASKFQLRDKSKKRKKK